MYTCSESEESPFVDLAVNHKSLPTEPTHFSMDMSYAHGLLIDVVMIVSFHETNV